LAQTSSSWFSGGTGLFTSPHQGVCHLKEGRTKNEKIFLRGARYGYSCSLLTRLLLKWLIPCLHLVERGYHRREINLLFAMYNDYVLSPWRAEHLESKQSVPAFDMEHLLAIAQRGDYDWMLKE
jgi:hypothetical protein